MFGSNGRLAGGVLTLTRGGKRESLWSWGATPVGRLVAFPDRGSAERYMQAYLRDPSAIVALRSMLADELRTGSVSRLTDADVIEQVALRLASRRLLLTQDLTERVAPSGMAAPAREEPPPPGNKKEEEHELILILEDKKGKRLPRQRYVVAFPSGEKYSGRLGADGQARLVNVPPGNPRVFFPDHYVEAPHGHRPPSAKHCGGRR
jgi:hypothetical protein